MRFDPAFITLADLYRAYRKAKSDAFFESMHFDGFAYARYENSLDRNLRRLLSLLQKGDWARDPKFIGTYSYAPKSLGDLPCPTTQQLHFSQLDSFADWVGRFEANGRARADADFRLLIRATVNYQIIAALWILKVGHLFEQALDKDLSYGNRLRRHRPGGSGPGELNRDCIGLFTPYFGAYRQWRANGMRAMREELEKKNRIVAVTMDVHRFYHKAAPTFLMSEDFHRYVGIGVTDDQQRLTADLVESICSWYSTTPDFSSRPEGALPIGLSASKVIANVLLAEFDELIGRKLAPVYYGRYVDDIFLVLHPDASIRSGEEFLDWLAKKFPARLKFESASGEYSLRFSPPYSDDSEIRFTGKKQKIFLLEGRYGLDLVDHIEQQIRLKSSEYKRLPILPLTVGEMLANALLATPDATLEADALRKADVVSVRRLGFSLLLGDVESYARDLRPKEWQVPRRVFYGLVERHVLTPRGIFDYFGYINRVFGVMVSCGDLKEAESFIARFLQVANLIRDTTTGGTTESEKYDRCLALYASAFFQAAIQASTVKGFVFGNSFLALLRAIRAVSTSIVTPATRASARKLSHDLLKCDFGRRPYKEYWYFEKAAVAVSPAVPKDPAVRRVLRLGAIRRFRKDFVGKALREPYWPALAFPTRPLTLPEITQIAPRVFDDPGGFLATILALRGARVGMSPPPIRFSLPERPHIHHIKVPAEARDQVTVAVVNFKTTEDQWNLALRGQQDRSLARYFKYNKIVNDILALNKRVDYIAFPEASVPRKWAFATAQKLARLNVSLLAGLENSSGDGPFRNDALISLATTWPGYRTHLRYLQPKMSPAVHELAALRATKRRLFTSSDVEYCRPVFVHGGHCFGVLLCSDLTNISNRRHFQGHVDSLFVLEWNPDLNSFGALVESAALDLHAYVVQVNNRMYGDSRVRAPRILTYERDLVRVKGGDADYFVLASLKLADLRRFQSSSRPAAKLGFKPKPIGFVMSPIRKVVLGRGQRERSG